MGAIEIGLEQIEVVAEGEKLGQKPFAFSGGVEDQEIRMVADETPERKDRKGKPGGGNMECGIKRIRMDAPDRNF